MFQNLSDCCRFHVLLTLKISSDYRRNRYNWNNRCDGNEWIIYSLVSKRVVDRYGAMKINAGVNMRESVPVTASDTVSIFFVFFASFRASASATALEIATGSPTCTSVMTRISVGKAIIYSPTPSSPIILAITIRLIKPSNLVIKPATIKMIVPLRNFDMICPCLLKIAPFDYNEVYASWWTNNDKLSMKLWKGGLIVEIHKHLYDDYIHMLTPVLESKADEFIVLGYGKVEIRDIWKFLTRKNGESLKKGFAFMN